MEAWLHMLRVPARRNTVTFAYRLPLLAVHTHIYATRYLWSMYSYHAVVIKLARLPQRCRCRLDRGPEYNILSYLCLRQWDAIMGRKCQFEINVSRSRRITLGPMIGGPRVNQSRYQRWFQPALNPAGRNRVERDRTLAHDSEARTQVHTDRVRDF